MVSPGDGRVLLLRDPFRAGNQIQVAGYEGTVQGVTVREAPLQTYDGQLVLIPNAQVYINPLEVRTHRPYTRNALELRLDVGADPGAATEAMLRPLQDLRPEDAPEPQVVVLGGRERCPRGGGDDLDASDAYQPGRRG